MYPQRFNTIAVAAHVAAPNASSAVRVHFTNRANTPIAQAAARVAARVIWSARATLGSLTRYSLPSSDLLVIVVLFSYPPMITYSGTRLFIGSDGDYLFPQM